jgi:uncharacterized protein (TIGR02217 family)
MAQVVAFHESLFPPDISAGSRGGPGFRTIIVESDSGHEQRVSKWGVPRHQYRLDYGVRDREDMATLKRFFIARRGAAHGFRLLDPLDHSTAEDGHSDPATNDVVLATGPDVTEFQFIKRYIDGDIQRVRPLRKIEEGSVVLAVNGVQIFSGWSVDYTTGHGLLTTPLSAGQTLSGGCRFHVPVRFGAEVDELLDFALDGVDVASVPQITAVELIGDVFQAQETIMGGASDLGEIESNQLVSAGMGRVISFTPTAAGLEIHLPDYQHLEPGGPHFYLVNLSDTHSVDVVSPAGAEGSIAADSMTEVVVGVTGYHLLSGV